MTEGAVIALAVGVVAVCGFVAFDAARRADEAVNAAARAARAANAARRHCDALTELLAEVSPTARQVRFAIREHRSPVVAAAHRRMFARPGHRIDEGTT
jgi:hypothetical protein